MRTIALTSASLVLLLSQLGLAQTPTTPAAPNAAAIKTANDYAVVLQGLREDLRRKLTDAQGAAKQGDFVAAAKYYEDAYTISRQIPAGIDAEKKELIGGMVKVRINLAEQADRRGDFPEADAQIRRLMVIDPKNEDVLAYQATHAKLVERMQGKRPDERAIEQLAGVQAKRIEGGTCIQNGKLLFEAGKLDEAEQQMKRGLELDPDNPAGPYYLDLIREQREKRADWLKANISKQKISDVTQAWLDSPTRDKLPQPNPYARTNLVTTSKERGELYKTLNRIRLDSLQFDAPLSEVLKQLSAEAKGRDPDRKGINFMLSANIDPLPTKEGLVDPATGLAAPPPEAPDLGAVLIKINPPLYNLTLLQALDAICKVADKQIKFSVEDYSVVFSLKPIESPVLHVRQFKVDPNTFLQGLQGVTQMQFGSSGGGGYGGGGYGGYGGGGYGGYGGGGYGGYGGGGYGGYGGNRGGYGGGGYGGYGGGGYGGGGYGGYGGGGYGGYGGGGYGGGGYGGYGGGGYGGGYGGGGGGQSAYIGVDLLRGGSSSSRTTRSNGSTQQNNQNNQNGVQGPQGPGAAGGGFGGGSGIRSLTRETTQDEATGVVVDFFGALGIELRSPGRIVVFNDRLGMLMVKATLAELDLIEKIIQVLNMAPPQVTIEAKFAEVTQDDNRALGFDWTVGNFLMGGGRVGMQPGTAPSYVGQPSTANPTGIFPGPSGSAGVIPPSPTDNRLGGGLRNAAPAIGTISGILTDPQFRLVISALEQRTGVDVISAPKITTLSSRQTEIKVVNLDYVVTQLDYSQTSAGGGGSSYVNAGSSGAAVASAIVPIAEPMEFGPVLDVVPYVCADGYTIQMTIIPTIREFVGYDFETAKNFVAQVQSVSGNGASSPLQMATPMPKFRLRQVVTSAIVWDHQTLMLGGLISENVQKQKDKVPGLGDIPLVGRLFRSESSLTQKKNLLIFVTPTIIDPAGNRLHTDEEMPFAQNDIPDQTLRAPVPTPSTVTP